MPKRCMPDICLIAYILGNIGLKYLKDIAQDLDVSRMHIYRVLKRNNIPYFLNRDWSSLYSGSELEFFKNEKNEIICWKYWKNIIKN